MTRVLHLLAEASDEQARRLSALLIRNATADVSIEPRTVGRGGTYRSVVHAALGLRREQGGFDLVHAWDAEGWSAAQLAGARSVVLSPSVGIPRVTLGAGWRRTGPHGRVDVVCSTTGQLNAATSQFPKDHCHLIEPGAEIECPRWTPDTLRLNLGLNIDDRVLLAPGDSTRAAGHETAVWVTSMLHIIDPRFKLLIAGTGPRVSAARQLAERLKRPKLLCVGSDRVDASSSDLPIVADAALHTPSEVAPPLPVLECMTAGLPIITTDHPSLAGLFRAETLAAVADRTKPPEIARKVLEAFERPDALREAGRRARAEGGGRFSPARYIERYEALYRRVATGRRSDHAAVA